jgi:hypothetical protein
LDSAGLKTNGDVTFQKLMKAAKKQSLLKCLANKNWGADQETLLRVPQMIVLSSLECVWSNTKCTAEKNVRILSRPEHPMRTMLTDTKEYDDYTVRLKLTIPYPIRALCFTKY